MFFFLRYLELCTYLVHGYDVILVLNLTEELSFSSFSFSALKTQMMSYPLTKYVQRTHAFLLIVH